VKLNDYECAGCDTEMKDQEETPTCPTCKKVMRKKFKSPGIIYKGSGYTGAQKGKEARDGN